jgi:iron complex transport system substrate-binding protein
VGLPDAHACRACRSASDSLAIDRSSPQPAREGSGVYEVDVDALRAARPDVIVTQDLCDVCAVSYDDVCAAARTLGNPDVRVVNLHPTRLADVSTDLRKVGVAIGREPRARSRSMEARMERVRDEPRTWLARACSPSSGSSP